MKKRKAVALILACSMLLGQTVWAQDAGAMKEASRETQGDVDIGAVPTQEPTEDLAAQEQQELQEEQIGNAASSNAVKTENLTEAEINQQQKEEQDVITQEETKEEKEEEGQTEEEEEAEEEGLEAQAAEIQKKTTCVNYPIMIDLGWGTLNGDADKAEADFAVNSENGEICEATKGIYRGANGSYWLYFTVNGKKEGTTTVNASFSGKTRKYEITVNALPEDAVMFKDTGLRSLLVDDGHDTNKDGCISKGELEKATQMSFFFNNFSAIPVKDLTGLENAVNLTSIDLRGNAELSDISILFGLKKLQSVQLRGTNVSDADRWKMADFKDCSLSKGDRIYLPALGDIFEEGLTVEAVNNQDSIEIIEDEGSVTEILAKEAGETKLHISYHELSKDITVTVQGIEADQEVGEDYPGGIRPRPSIAANAYYSNEGLILDSNHQLWQLYPEPVKKKDNVKDYVANWVYYGTDRKNAEIRTYLLDNDNNLWKDTEKLSENVEKFDGRYALDSKGILHNLYNSGNEQIENVADWLSPSYESKGTAYLLKKDGTLWTRQESAADQKTEEWKKVDSNVKQFYEEGYLKTDGAIVSFDGTKTTDIKADRMCADGSFYDKDGNYYLCMERWNDSTKEYEKEYMNIGKIDVKQVEIYGNNGAIILNQDKQVYKYDVATKKLELVMSGVLRINEGLPYYWNDSTSWAFQSSDGKYYDLEGKAMAKVRVGYAGSDDELIWGEDGSQAVVRNGVTILSNVTTIWSDRIEGKWMIYACRTDGTIWDITGVPKRILDLKSASYLKGDVNEDGTVDIKDLRLVLRHVCEKIKLTDRQIMIADVVKDGNVNIHDLRKELRYVCGKLETLD